MTQAEFPWPFDEAFMPAEVRRNGGLDCFKAPGRWSGHHEICMLE